MTTNRSYRKAMSPADALVATVDAKAYEGRGVPVFDLSR